MSEEVNIEHLRTLLEEVQRATQALDEYLEQSAVSGGDFEKAARSVVRDVEASETARMIEGIFDGNHMLGMDGKQYTVPANYASKSKLVEGDRLKLTIAKDGTFIYKQIGPVERERKVGALQSDSSGEFTVQVDGWAYRVLQASVTYFHGAAGDQAVLLVPAGKLSRWAAVENIVKQ